MEMRNGVYTSQGKSDDCDEIARLARRIQEHNGDPIKLARRIESLASQLAHELR